MNIEDLLRAEAAAVADRASPSPPDIDGMRHRGLRMRRSRRAAAAGVVFVAVTLGGLLLLGRIGPDSEHPPADERGGSLSGPVWWAEDRIHAGERVYAVETPGNEGRAIGLVRDGVVYVAGGYLYLQPSEGGPLRLGEAPDWGVVGDPEGSTAAWIDDGHLVIHDTDADAQLASIPVERRRYGLFGAPPVLLLDDRRVVYESRGVVWQKWLGPEAGPPTALRTAARLVDLTDRIRVVEGPIVADALGGEHALTRLSILTAGAEPIRHGPVFREGTLSSDSRYLALVTGYQDGHRLRVVETDTGRVVPLDLPNLPLGGWTLPMSWSYGDSLMVVLLDESMRGSEKYPLYTCEVDERTCSMVSTEARPLLLPNRGSY